MVEGNGRNVQKMLDLMNQSHQHELEWVRHILTISAGALAILAGLGPEAQGQSIQTWALAGTWICLGTGICCASAATYRQAYRSKKLADRFRSELQTALEEDRKMRIVSAPLPWLLRASLPACAASLIAAVVCITVYAVTATLG